VLHCETTKPQSRLKADRPSLLQPVWDYAATSARSVLGAIPGGRRLDGRRASVRVQLRALRQIDNVLLDRVRDSVHKSSPNPGRATVPANAIWAPAFRMLCESPTQDWNPEMVDVRPAC